VDVDLLLGVRYFYLCFAALVGDENGREKIEFVVRGDFLRREREREEYETEKMAEGI